MSRILVIILATLAAHLVGSAALFGVVSGPHAILASPLLSLFGWFFIPIEAMVVAAQSVLMHGSRHRIARIWLMTVIPSVVVTAIIGPKVNGEFSQWAIAYAVSAMLATSTSLLIVATPKRRSASLVAPENGG